MANLRDAKRVMHNAQALELFMRVSPEAATFLDCFSFKGGPYAQAVFNYYSASGAEDASSALGCYHHLKILFEHMGKNVSGEEPSQPRGDITIQAPVPLGNSSAGRMILQAAAEQINERLRADPNYSLSCFREDPPEAQKLLDSGFKKQVTAKDLEPLLPHMHILAGEFRDAKLPEWYR